MYIVIKKPVRYTKEDIESKSTYLGIVYSDYNNGSGHMVYEVRDKQLFMLAVIKYGIEFTEVQNEFNHYSK